MDRENDELSDRLTAAVVVALDCRLIHLPATPWTGVPINRAMAQPQIYPSGTMLPVLVSQHQSQVSGSGGPGTLTHTKQTLAPSSATPNPTAASPAQSPVTHGHGERVAGPACAALGRVVPS